MSTVLLALLAVADAPLVEARSLPEPAVEVRQDLREPEPASAVKPLLGWGYSLTTVGVVNFAVAAVMYGMLSASSARCRASAGCIDESGLAYLVTLLPALVGFVHTAVGVPLLARGLHLQRLADATPADER
jgi:hypothetical protein